MEREQTLLHRQLLATHKKRLGRGVLRCCTSGVSEGSNVNLQSSTVSDKAHRCVIIITITTTALLMHPYECLAYLRVRSAHS
jgi:hypothetical protein